MVNNESTPKSTILVKIAAERIFEPCLLTAERQAQLSIDNSSTVDKKNERDLKILENEWSDTSVVQHFGVGQKRLFRVNSTMINKLLVIAFLGIIVLGLTNCKKEIDCCTIIDVDVQIHYQTQTGDDLINSTNDFEESNIKVYYKNQDKFEYAYDANLSHPNMHRLDEVNGNLILTVFPSNHYVENRSTTLIELNENLKDTLVCEFEFDKNSTICKKAWLNGEEFEDRFIEVKK